MNFEHLRALAAVVDGGSFEAGAQRLGVTPSAISQRIKALESYVGCMVVRRNSPVSPTATGMELLRLARQVRALEVDTQTSLGLADASPRTELPIVVDDVSMVTWFGAVLREAGTWANATLNLRVEDSGVALELLQQGEIVGAVTSNGTKVAGSRVEYLGFMRYVPVAAAELYESFGTARGIDWGRMPRIATDSISESMLLQSWKQDIQLVPVHHVLASSSGVLAAVNAGLGWAMVPELQCKPEVAKGSLLLLDEDLHVDVALYWHAWALDVGALQQLSDSVGRIGRQQLRSVVAGDNSA